MVATLTRIFGVQNLALAEDVVQDAFCRAVEVWKFRGVPENPSAWLMATAKNRALDVLRRERTARTYAPELARWLQSEWTLAPAVEELFGAAEIKDDQLRMMFSCCHPRLSEEASVALMLNLLCGFSVTEIAGAFLAGDAAIAKRIARGKKVLAGSKKLFDVNDRQFAARLSSVHRALYLLFNEGYHGASPDAAVRADLCQEAMRLCGVLLEHTRASTPATHALMALMQLHAARLPARLDAAGNLVPLSEQERSRWDARQIAEGLKHLERSAEGKGVTEYQLEAAIAALHATARSVEETDWNAIISLYDALLALHPSPVIALNRAIAVAQRDGPERGLAEIGAIEDRDRLDAYPFYFAALGELELRAGRPAAGREHFRAAAALARNAAEQRFLDGRVQACEALRAE